MPRAHPGTEVVLVPAANLTPDDLLVNAPVRDDRTGELVLAPADHASADARACPSCCSSTTRCRPGETIQSQLMQIACNWTLGEHDLRELGCVGVFLADNESLAETSARRSDLAVLDRMVTLRITANDTAWRSTLAERYEDWDLTGVFRIWAALTPYLRSLLSPRTLQHVLDCARAGFPLSWGLPLVGGVRLRLRDRKADGTPGADRTAELLDAHRRGARRPQPGHHSRPGTEHSAHRGPGALGGAAPGPARLRQDGDRRRRSSARRADASRCTSRCR